MAERIVLELKDKVEAFVPVGEEGAGETSISKGTSLAAEQVVEDLDGVPVHRLSFIPETGIALPETEDAHAALDPMLGHYLAYLDGRGEYVVDGVRRIAGLESGTTVVHCAAGKDRTGVLVALVCAAVGVPREEITADYALSATRIDALFRKWTTASGEPMPGADELDRHRPRAEVMAEFLRLLDERHGGPVGWLRENGLTEDELTRLRTRLRDGSA